MSLLIGCVTFLLTELIWTNHFAQAVAWPSFISVPAGLLCCITAAVWAHNIAWYFLSLREDALNNPAPLYTWKRDTVAIAEVLEALTDYKFQGIDLQVDHSERLRVRATRWLSSRSWTGTSWLRIASEIYNVATLSLFAVQVHFAVSVRIEQYNEFNSKVYIEFTNQVNRRIINIWGASIRSDLMRLLIDLLQCRTQPYTEKMVLPAVAASNIESGIGQDELAGIWQAANNGDPEALLRLGRMYAHGVGVLQSWTDAAACIGLAASNGHVDAMYEYGSMLCQGLGVAADVQQGLQWYQTAAARGHAEAGRTLEMIYESVREK